MEVKQIQHYLGILQVPSDQPREFRLMVAEHVLAQLKKNPSTKAIKEATKLEEAATEIKNVALRCQEAFLYEIRYI